MALFNLKKKSSFLCAMLCYSSKIKQSILKHYSNNYYNHKMKKSLISTKNNLLCPIIRSIILHSNWFWQVSHFAFFYEFLEINYASDNTKQNKLQHLLLNLLLLKFLHLPTWGWMLSRLPSTGSSATQTQAGSGQTQWGVTFLSRFQSKFWKEG